VVENRALADSLMQRIRLGEALGPLAMRYSIRPGADATAGDLGWVSAEHLGALRDTIMATNAGECIGPFPLYGRYVLLQVEGKRPARSMDFQEARPLIEVRVRERWVTQRMHEYLDQLRERYKPEVDREWLRQFPLLKENNPLSLVNH